MRAALLLSLLVLGCDASGSPGDLVVRVKSDLQPGYEFTEVRTRIVGAGTSSDEEQIVRALTSEHPSYLSGREVAVYEAVQGTSEPVVNVRVMAGEVVVLERNAIARIEGGGAAVLTVLATRDCRSVTCPGVSGAPNESECVGGACVARTCTPESPGTCPAPPCSRDSDCDERGIECARARCADGRCLLAADESLCGVAETCVLDVGCVGSPEDAGVQPDAAP